MCKICHLRRRSFGLAPIKGKHSHVKSYANSVGHALHEASEFTPKKDYIDKKGRIHLAIDKNTIWDSKRGWIKKWIY